MMFSVLLTSSLLAGVHAQACTQNLPGAYCANNGKFYPEDECCFYNDAYTTCPSSCGCEAHDDCPQRSYCSKDGGCYPIGECQNFGDGVSGCPVAHSCTLFRAASTDKAVIQAEIDKFTAAIGGSVNGNAKGDQGSGFRGINWDADPVPFLFPSQFFNLQVTRGAAFSTPGSDMVVSDPTEGENASPGSSFGTGAANAGLAAFRSSRRAFVPFTGKRIFCPRVQTTFQTRFFVSGSTEPAKTRAYGIVALDLKAGGGAELQLFDGDNNALRNVPFLANGNPPFSFAGVVCANPVIDAAAVTLGNGPLEVCVDDVFYGEPTKRT